MFIRNKLPLITAIAVIAFLIIFPKESADSISRGLSYSLEILIPSLFPYIVISSFIMRTNASVCIGNVFAPVCRTVFGLPKCCSGAIILSFIGGFPVGAKCVQILFIQGKINVSQAEHMMKFCVCAGPAFLITAVGAIMLNNPETGVILYISQLISALIIGIISVDRKKNSSSNTQKIENVELNKSVTSAFIESVSDALSSVFSISALVMVFSMLITVVKILVPQTYIFAAILLEVTSACKEISNTSMPLWVYSIAVGLGGFCIHFQIFDILRDVPIIKTKYIIYRVVNSLLSGLITYVICLFYRPDTDVFRLMNGAEAEVSSAGYTGSAALLILSVVFALAMRRKNYKCNKYLFCAI